MSDNGTLNTLIVRESLSSPDDQQYQFPVNYAYDYLNGRVEYLMRPRLRLNDQLKSSMNVGKGDGVNCPSHNENAIDIFPTRAGLPWHSGIIHCRQSKHWQYIIDCTKEFLSLCVEDEICQEIVKADHSIADIAQKELCTRVEEGWAKFTAYHYSDGDRQRMRLITILHAAIFVFDDFWEMDNIQAFSTVQKHFVDRMCESPPHGDAKTSPLQHMIDEAVAEAWALDHKYNNTAGQEMIDLAVAFFKRPPPPESYNNMEEYLLYRHEDAAALFVLSCTKFSLNSSVDLNDPKLARYIHLAKDHISVANDLASWDKEQRAYDKGDVIYIINAVDIVKKLFCLSSDDAAVRLTQSLLFQIEIDMDEEIQRLKAENALTAEEWQFVDSTLRTLSANVFVGVVMARYGGEVCRLE